MEISKNELRELFDAIGNKRFKGIRILKDTPIVRCRGKSFPDHYFGPRSLMGKSRKEYYEKIKEYGLTPEKEYVAIKVEGWGDAFNICIKENDEGKEVWYMSNMFELI